MLTRACLFQAEAERKNVPIGTAKMLDPSPDNAAEHGRAAVRSQQSGLQFGLLLHRRTNMKMKTLAMAAAGLLLVSGSAWAQKAGGGEMAGGGGGGATAGTTTGGTTGGGTTGATSGTVSKTPGHMMQSGKYPNTGPGASEYSPGHLKRSGKLGGPGASQYTPSHRPSATTGLSSKSSTRTGTSTRSKTDLNTGTRQ